MSLALLRGGACSGLLVEVDDDTQGLFVEVHHNDVVSAVLQTLRTTYIYKRTGRGELVNDPKHRKTFITATIFEVDFRLMRENFQFEFSWA